MQPLYYSPKPVWWYGYKGMIYHEGCDGRVSGIWESSRYDFVWITEYVGGRFKMIQKLLPRVRCEYCKQEGLGRMVA